MLIYAYLHKVTVIFSRCIWPWVGGLCETFICMPSPGFGSHSLLHFGRTIHKLTWHFYKPNMCTHGPESEPNHSKLIASKAASGAHKPLIGRRMDVDMDVAQMDSRNYGRTYHGHGQKSEEEKMRGGSASDRSSNRLPFYASINLITQSYKMCKNKEPLAQVENGPWMNFHISNFSDSNKVYGSTLSFLAIYALQKKVLSCE